MGRSIDMFPQPAIDYIVRCAQQDRMAEHFAMLDADFEGGPVAGRFVLYERGGLEDAWEDIYITSWDTLDDARAAFPLPPNIILRDDKTGIYWTSEGLFQ